jgi:hypothetical protein
MTGESEPYELRLYDRQLLTFKFVVGELSETEAKILSIDNNNKALLPIEMLLPSTIPQDETFMNWLRGRVIPKNRTFAYEILATLGLTYNDAKGIIDVCMGLSLNDSYWIIPYGFPGKFSEFNLYENRFSEALSLVAYTGIGAVDKAFSTSPELTTDGGLQKAWRLMDGDGIFLYKGGSREYANAGLEPYSEFYASQIAEKMELDCVHYDLEQWEGMLASKCKLFTDINTSFVSIWKILPNRGLSVIMKYYRDKGEKFSDALSDMLVFDAVIYNQDRHHGNSGVLRDNLTGEVIAPAPIFDNGMSLFFHAMENDIKDIDRYAARLQPRSGYTSFEDLAKAVIGPRQITKLRKLINFEFRRHPHYNLPEWRLKAIEKHIGKRVPVLLDLAKKSA